MVARSLIVSLVVTFVVHNLVDSVGARVLDGSSIYQVNRSADPRPRRNLDKRQDEEESGFGFDVNNDVSEYEVEVSDDESAAEDEAEQEAEDTATGDEEEGQEEEGQEGEGENEAESEEGSSETEEAEETAVDEAEEEPEEEVAEEENEVNEVGHSSHLGRRAGNSKSLSSRGGSGNQNGRSSGNDDDASGPRDAGFNNFASKLGVVVKSIGEGLGLGSRVGGVGDEADTGPLDQLVGSNSRSIVDNRINPISNLEENSRSNVANIANNMRQATVPMNSDGPKMPSRPDGMRRPNGIPPLTGQRPNDLMRHQALN